MRAGIAKIQENAKEIAQLLVREQGKPFTEAMENFTTSCTG